MHNFIYVTKKQAKPIKDELYQILFKVQNIVRDSFTFQFTPVGSSSKNMITYDKKSNIGFDFDFNIKINDDDENYSPTEIRNKIKNAINKVAVQYGYKNCEDSTSVLTIKKINKSTCKIIHSCDFAIVYNCNDGKQQYIRFNKKNNNYTWEFRGNEFNGLSKKIKWLKNNHYWKDLRDYYIDKKNRNNNSNKHSRSIFAESINEMYQKKKNL